MLIAIESSEYLLLLNRRVKVGIFENKHCKPRMVHNTEMEWTWMKIELLAYGIVLNKIKIQKININIDNVLIINQCKNPEN